MEQTELDKLNNIALQRFQLIKDKLKCDILIPLVPSGSKVAGLAKGYKMGDEKLAKLLEESFAVSDLPAKEKAEEACKFVDETFSFIESLNLPPTLSLAIAKIISYGKTKQEIDLSHAADIINEYIVEVFINERKN